MKLSWKWGGAVLATALLVGLWWWPRHGPSDQTAPAPAAEPTRKPSLVQPPGQTPLAEPPREPSAATRAALPDPASADRRTGSMPNPTGPTFARRTQEILRVFRSDRDARVLPTLLRPRPTREAIRGALEIAAEFSPDERDQVVETLRGLMSPPLQEILESLARTDPRPQVRALALDLLP